MSIIAHPVMPSRPHPALVVLVDDLPAGTAADLDGNTLRVRAGADIDDVVRATGDALRAVLTGSALYARTTRHLSLVTS